MFHVKHCQSRTTLEISKAGKGDPEPGGLFSTGGTVGRLGGTPPAGSVLDVLPGGDEQLAQAVTLRYIKRARI